MYFRTIQGTAIRSALALVQTDGSFRKSQGRVAAMLFANHQRYTLLQTIQAHDSYETEWCSVYTGLLFGLENNAKTIHIENDNLGVIEVLTSPYKSRKGQANAYRERILRLAKETDYTAVRWIPRKLNRADSLFRGPM